MQIETIAGIVLGPLLVKGLAALILKVVPEKWRRILGKSFG